MSTNDKNDYGKYVIVDGRLVGEFEEMYRNCVDPWNQDSVIPNCPLRHAIIGYSKQIGATDIVEVGCGKGLFTETLHRSLGSGVRVTGVDLSRTAISNARQRFSGPEFIEAHAKDTEKYLSDKTDLVIMSQITWYILDDLREVLKAFKEKISGCYLLHHLTFYPPGRQKYGNQFFSSPEQLIKYFNFRVLDSVTRNSYDVDTGEISAIDSLLLFRV